MSWLLASAYGAITGDDVSVTHANAAVLWSQMSGSCKGECLECRHESAEVREAANVCVQSLVDSYLNEKPDEATLVRVRKEMFEVRAVPTNRVAQRPGSYGAPVMKRPKAEDKQTSQAASPSAKMTPIKAPVPTRTVTTRQAPPEFKQPPPPPPLREERKEPQFGQGRLFAVQHLAQHETACARSFAGSFSLAGLCFVESFECQCQPSGGRATPDE